ncbi:hypothetical protein [Limnohabitans sp. Rim8]|uniref:hypothetical protein n=1 Tax=Limnohabitans sp. Rim8 TaxID=1100718 RepID=UPI00345C27D6
MLFIQHSIATWLLPLGLLACALSHAQDGAPSGTGPAVNPNGSPNVSPTNANTATNNEGPNAMTRAAVQRGILQCAARVEQVSKFSGFGAQAGGLLMAPANPSDQRLFALQMEVPAGAANNSFVDMDFAPNQANGCGASYAAVSYWAQSCDQVANKQFGQLKRLQPLRRDVAVLDGGNATTLTSKKSPRMKCWLAWSSALQPCWRTMMLCFSRTTARVAWPTSAK